MAIASADEPVRLTEDETTGGRFLIYGTDKGVRIELRYEGDTLWMTQAQMADLFGVDRRTINEHLGNIYKEGELDHSATCRNFRQVRQEGSRQVTREIPQYNLDAVISVGYRVSSRQATLFRIWATDKLVQFATKGFVIDAERLKKPEDQDRLAELREIIRDIRSDEANVYRELRRICAMCQDYNEKPQAWRIFYTHMQAKLMWAVTSHTPSEVVVKRADGEAANLGLRTWPKDNIRQADALVAKNYLSEPEVRELNRVTTILLDIFEDQMSIGKLTLMAEAEALLDRQLKSLNRPLLTHGGTVSAETAKDHAKRHYAVYKETLKAERHAQADASIADLSTQAKRLAVKKKQNFS